MDAVNNTGVEKITISTATEKEKKPMKPKPKNRALLRVRTQMYYQQEQPGALKDSTFPSQGTIASPM